MIGEELAHERPEVGADDRHELLAGALIASTTCESMPDVQMPSDVVVLPAGDEVVDQLGGVAGSQPVATPSAFGSTLMSG